jgi:hypothetical protein
MKSDKWAAFLDIDEFIVLKNYTTIGNLLEDHVKQNVACLGMNWVLFGSSHKKYYSNEPVLKRFTYRSNQTHHTLKSICHMASIKLFSSPHWPQLLSASLKKLDMGGREYSMHFSKNAYESPAVIYHYHTKSYEEYKAKIARGRATKTSDHSRAHYDLKHYWALRDINDYEDHTSWNDFKNRLKIVGDISLPVDQIKTILMKSCHGNRHCNIARVAQEMID